MRKRMCVSVFSCLYVYIYAWEDVCRSVCVCVK